MTLQLFLNIVIAFVWMFLQNSWSIATFVIGYLLGMLLLFAFRRFFAQRFYMHNVISIVKLLFIFLRELIKSNITVIRHILKPKLDIRPGIFALPTELKQDWEITTLANLITLTPGTVVVDVSDDNKILYVHAMDIEDKEKAIYEIKTTFEKAIMEVSK
ncbi:Na+/H+ antiporter subunit E [Bacillus sp. HMF5848]|uniref:Na+/H+ antiporter subunit E n=1 Tax=Bacillus sp. HMF5848 TaxID=2495421 RepID=UPI000F79F2BE|nr:Na+/H+ antiporter subunit E [Bacillus sp. HMF5848]RSK28585.1 Na+/H+ antiporter subunit E [Bacillus sp. HMF5848]